MDSENERRLRRNWNLLKQELPVDSFVHQLIADGVFAPNMRSEILNVIPNTASMKAEKFLNAILQTGNRAYEAMIRFISLHPDNRYSRVIQALNIPVVSNDNPPARSGNAANNSQPQADSRPSTATSSGTINSETGEKHRRVVPVRNVRPEENPRSIMGTAPVATVAPLVSVSQNAPALVPAASTAAVIPAPLAAPAPPTRDPSSGDSSASVTPQALFVDSRIGENFIGSRIATQSEMSLASFNTESSDEFGAQMGADAGSPSTADGEPNVRQPTAECPMDMKVLEQELVRIAPTIADLFKKISKQTSSVPTSEEELQKIKDENERLRKTNKSLIEKLNAFQQKIIQLQLDNKKLKENSEMGRAKKGELQQKTVELQAMERRLDDHKRALEEKEAELNTQLLKLKEIEEENHEQREKIDKLVELQDEGIIERNIQQEQISTLVEEKERQKDQIESLEEQQKVGEHRLSSLEERLKLLEHTPRQKGRNRRVMSPPRSTHWMNGYVDHSHHANVKYQSEIKFDPHKNGGKRTSSMGKAAWPFA
ncbi:uncharacterized protein LOC127838963 [Dreissena polymorpha]|uniref:CARD domain-containing protein n=1 Tax=Dreissena polymorpha TaxID=45954 RepID=A0A9D4FD64_DREPO|nr:uncharacterized protein LOC127838963 [Dreissena polymorpha]KAH3794456.1 hypothetical protein DPMN_147989 [Dreissena polymorpha]